MAALIRAALVRQSGRGKGARERGAVSGKANKKRTLRFGAAFQVQRVDRFNFYAHT